MLGREFFDAYFVSMFYVIAYSHVFKVFCIVVVFISVYMVDCEIFWSWPYEGFSHDRVDCLVGFGSVFIENGNRFIPSSLFSDSRFYFSNSEQFSIRANEIMILLES